MTAEISDDSLNILEPPIYDNSIESWQYYDYTPQSQHNLDRAGRPIQIDINTTEEYIQPSRSYISITGQLVRADNGNEYALNDRISLINNAMMYIFTEIKYSIGGTEIEKISSPGQATSMLGYLLKDDLFPNSSFLKLCWGRDTSNSADNRKFDASPAVTAGAAINAGYFTPVENSNYNEGFATRHALLMSANPRGSFCFNIPFEHIFGFSHYNKVIRGVKHSLSLTRNTSNNLAIHRAAGVPDGRIRLTNITWRVPYVKMEISKLMELRDIIAKKTPIPVAFKARTCESINVPTGSRKFEWRLNVSDGIEKPRWIIVGFQIDRDGTQDQNPSVFDHVNLSKAYVTLNTKKYPMNDFNVNFEDNNYADLYEMLDNFKTDYYGCSSVTLISFIAFKRLFPLIVFDVRRQNESLKSGVIDMMLRFNFNQGIPDNTMAYAVIISDRAYKFISDGTNLTMMSK